jgi:hypothetical protein
MTNSAASITIPMASCICASSINAGTLDYTTIPLLIRENKGFLLYLDSTKTRETVVDTGGQVDSGVVDDSP